MISLIAFPGCPVNCIAVVSIQQLSAASGSRLEEAECGLIVSWKCMHGSMAVLPASLQARDTPPSDFTYPRVAVEAFCEEVR